MSYKVKDCSANVSDFAVINKKIIKDVSLKKAFMNIMLRGRETIAEHPEISNYTSQSGAMGK
jgi:hypothetical protein